jgi:hydroxymethylpyrimidine kinase/phosphomethylpyrimidine kinase/thiamine-phosphate diphosphorylase
MTERNSAGARRPVAWTIAGSDSGAGAGIHADARAFDAFGVHGACAVAAITAQNSLAVERVAPVTPDLLDAQLAALAADMPPDAVKTGLLGSVENLRVVTKWVKRLRAAGRPAPLVVDPVFGATTGAPFADDSLHTAYRNELLPLATLATPNVQEAQALAGRLSDIPALARAWREFGAQAVVVTGGDEDPVSPVACDWLDSAHVLPCAGWLTLPRISTGHHHGTGCTFAATAAAALAHGFVAADAAVLAKMSTAEALRHGWAAGSGAGPVGARSGFARRFENLPMLCGERPMRAGPAFKAMPSGTLGLYAVVDSANWVARVVAAGARLVQLRIKSCAPRELMQEVRAALAFASDAGATLIVNDHWQLALEMGAHGVHLGQEDLAGADIAALRSSGMLLGVSTHSCWEVCRAQALRPSYIACGPVHATQLKKMPWIPQGEANVAYWSALLAPTPVVAIGGMDAARARAAMSAGASSVAAVGAITRSSDPETAVAELRRAIEAGKRTRLEAPAPDWPRSTLAQG